MENSIVNTEKDIQQRDDENMELVQDGNLSKRLVRKVNGERLMILSIKNPQTSESCIQEPLLQGIYGLDTKIPIQISTFDEMYLRRCLELVHFSAFPKSTSYLSTRCTSDVASFGIEYPLISTDGDSILGTISRSQSMVNILKSPLFQNFGAVDIDANSRTTSPTGGLSVGSTQNLQREMVVLGDHKYGSDPVHKRVFSVSSTNSTCSDLSSSSTSNSVSHGILQCTWFEGTPHFVFSLDDQREVYVSKVSKANPFDDKDLDYMYTFYSRTGTGHEKYSDLVGKMKVSTSFTLCTNNSQVMETQFVLFGFIDSCVGETQHLTQSKNKGFSKKVGSVFRPGYLSRQRTLSKFVGTSTAILENSSWEPNQECGASFQENELLLPNLELAAIIVKDHIQGVVEEPRIGGWGLNFLKKVESMKITENEVSSSYESHQRNVSDCSTSMDIIIPAGFHGGPTIRIGGPTSLVDRWSSGGRCDCGGWDLGCPIRVLESKSNDDLTEVDIFVEGSKQDAPIMKMNGHDRLYYIHFHQPLSALQSFSIAAAIIHSHSPTLRPKVYRR